MIADLYLSVIDQCVICSLSAPCARRTEKYMDPETLAQRAQRRRETSQHTINAVLLILTHIIAVIVPMLIDMLQP